MKKIYVMLVFVFLQLSSFAQHHPHTEHGFILLGTKQLHAYHLAKFNSPHEYQVLFELELTDQSGKSLDIERIKKDHDADVLSLLSEDHFLIADLRALKRFRVKLFKGYLRDRQHRELLFENLVLEVVKIDYFQKISNSEASVNEKKIVMVCDSVERQFYGANLIRGVDDSLRNFEEIVELSSFFAGAGGENSESAELKCSDKLQGAEVEVRIGSERHPLLPFVEDFNLFGRIPAQGVWQFYISKKLVLDLASVN